MGAPLGAPGESDAASNLKALRPKMRLDDPFKATEHSLSRSDSADWPVALPDSPPDIRMAA